MRRIVARFEDDESAAAARAALQEAGYSPDAPSSDNPFFDPSASLPESRGLLWGGLFGGVLGAIVLSAMVAHVLWIPRLSPIMTAGPDALVALGSGLGAIAGGFLGGAIGTFRPVEVTSGPRVALHVPDDRATEVTELLRKHGATTVDATTTYHEQPGAAQEAPSSADDAE